VDIDARIGPSLLCIKVNLDPCLVAFLKDTLSQILIASGKLGAGWNAHVREDIHHYVRRKIFQQIDTFSVVFVKKRIVASSFSSVRTRLVLNHMVLWCVGY